LEIPERHGVSGLEGPPEQAEQKKKKQNKHVDNNDEDGNQNGE